LKRSAKGAYVKMNPFHLERYVAEQVHRYSIRELEADEWFYYALRGIVGERLS
jgi:hypothetical protein